MEQIFQEDSTSEEQPPETDGEDLFADQPEQRTDAAQIKQHAGLLNHSSCGCTEVVLIDHEGGLLIGFFDDLEVLTTALQAHSDKHIYVGNNPRPASWADNEFKRRSRASESDIDTVCSVVLDIDPADREKGTLGTPEQHNAALAVTTRIATEYSGAVIDSGGGAYVWLVFEPRTVQELGGAVEFKAKVSAWQKQIAQRYGVAAERLKIDATQDLVHVYRLAGTHNHKGDGRPCRIISLPSEPADKALGEILGIEVAEVASTKGIVFSTDELPERFEKLMVGDRKLKELFEEPSPDGDQSARDFALVCRCLEKGLTEEEAAATLWQAPYGKRQRDKRKPDYVEVTVRRAAEEVGANATDQGPRSKPSVLEMCQDGENQKIVCPRLAEYLHSQAPVFSLAGALYRYQDGVYLPDGETSIRRDVSNILSESFTGHRANEVVSYLQDKYSVSADDVDADAKILNVANGLLNVDTLELDGHDPQYLSITQVPVEFHSAAQCPAIHKFFSEVFPPDCTDLAYELVGYCLRRDLDPRTATLLLGKTHAGKSTFLGLLTPLLGAVNVVNIELQDFAEDPFATAQLFGKMINTFADIPATPLRRSSIFKALTGGDRISAQEKHRRRFDFKPTTKLIFSANRPPGTRDYSDAYYVRWCIIPFNNQFLGIAEDPDLLAKLTTKEELEGLLIAALKAARVIPATGRLSEPGSVQQAKTMFREATDTVATFVRDVCKVDAKEEVGRQFLWETKYKNWCVDNGFKHLSQQKFNERLNQVLPSLQETTPRIKGRQIKSWKGLGVKSEKDENDEWPEGAKTDLFE